MISIRGTYAPRCMNCRKEDLSVSVIKAFFTGGILRKPPTKIGLGESCRSAL